jgi:hypothetical protein
MRFLRRSVATSLSSLLSDFHWRRFMTNVCCSNRGIIRCVSNHARRLVSLLSQVDLVSSKRITFTGGRSEGPDQRSGERPRC